MRKRLALLVLFSFLLLWTSPLHAQEVQVAFDEDGTVHVIDREMEETLGLFPDYPGFEEARLFRLPDDSYELVIQYREDGQTLRTRESLTAGEVAQLRSRVQAAREETGTPPPQYIDGERKMLATTTLLGAAQGALIPLAFGIEDERVLGSFPLFGAAAGFGIPFYLTRSFPVSDAEATMTLAGGLQGLAHGVLLPVLIADDDVSGQAVAATMSGLSAAQSIGGYLLARRHGVSAGSAEALGYGSLYGLGYGLGAAVLLLGDDPDTDNIGRAIAGSMLVGSLAGTYTGFQAGQQFGYTAGDTRVNALIGSLGLQTATTAAVVADMEETRSVTGLVLAGTSAGLITGWGLVRHRDFTRAQANIISLGTFAGGLLGGGVSTLADASSDAASVLSLAGTTLGFGFTYWLLADEADVTEGGTLHINVNPFGGIDTPIKPTDMSPTLNVRYRY